MNSGSEKEIRLQGAPVSEGIAIGVPFFLSAAQEEVIPEFPIAIGEVDDEIARYRKALFSSREDLELLQSDLAHEGSLDAVSIIGTHIQMLEDPLITTDMEDRIRQMRQNTESVFRSAMNEFEERFLKAADPFFQQRLVDVVDVSKRILGHLGQKQKMALADVPGGAIVFTRELIPSHTASVRASSVGAFVTQIGGGHSHAALIARAKGIPYVANIDVQFLHAQQGEMVIVDGMTGDVIFNPTPKTLEKYQILKKRLTSNYQQLKKEVHLAAKTRDGCPIQVLANVGVLGDLEELEGQGAEGIGLFRTEYLLLEGGGSMPSEEEQVSMYRKFFERAPNGPVVIRVFDIGGDKNLQCFDALNQESHFVPGCRGIRFLLRHQDIFRTQLRALLRSADQVDMWILLPLISDIGELRAAKEIIHQLQVELNLSHTVPIGCMIEVPSAVMICDGLMQECDFISIGTNDLIQYTLGVDRSSPSMNDFCFPAHPSVIRMIKMIASEARRRHKPLSVCGEIASHPLFVPLLLGLGVDALSCAPRYIPLIKRTIRQCSLIDCYRLAEEILQLSDASVVADILRQHAILEEK
jgi:phosphotransferase system enzyme I (PtsI)